MTKPATLCKLDHRGLIAISGTDCLDFLQGIVSNDMNKVAAGNAVFATLLTPQGKFLFDFFIIPFEGGVLLDCDRSVMDALMKKLKMYKLRSDVTLTERDDLLVVGVYDQGDNFDTGLIAGATKVFADPRSDRAGLRAIIAPEKFDKLAASSDFNVVDAVDYDRHRLRCALPEGTLDLIPEKSTLLENGYDHLNAIDWDKGCYMGQELTARTKYRGLVKKRLIPVTIDGPAPDAGSEITQDGKNVGEMRSSRHDLGMALIRAEALETDTPLLCQGATLIPRNP